MLLGGCGDGGGATGEPDPTATVTSVASVASVTSVVSAPVASTTSAPVAPEVDDVPPVPDGPATALVDALVVAQPSSPGEYRRDAFGPGWSYDPETGCNTREVVLAEESGPGLVVGDRCKPLVGSWTSTYDGMVTSDPADLEIDHVVPLAEAWRTGAAAWTADRREVFANDLDDPGTLAAVSTRSNRSKQDSTPAQWLPDDDAARCRFVADWVRIKARWDLTVAPDEKVAITQVLAGC